MYFIILAYCHEFRISGYILYVPTPSSIPSMCNVCDRNINLCIQIYGSVKKKLCCYLLIVSVKKVLLNEKGREKRHGEK